MSDSPLHPDDQAELIRIRNKIDSIRGDGVVNTPTAITINPPSRRPYYPTQKPPPFLVRITAVSGSFPLFTYTGKRVTGYDAGQTGAARAVTDGDDLTIINGFELVANAATYTHATGVSITNNDGTVNSGSCKIKSLGVGAVVFVQALPNATSSGFTYMFSMANSAQG